MTRCGCPSVAALALSLAACVPAAAPRTAPPDACGADRQQGLVGQTAPGLTSVSIEREVRLIRPASRPATDFRPERLNIELDAAERIVRVFCG
jgi:hypothetical protein